MAWRRRNFLWHLLLVLPTTIPVVGRAAPAGSPEEVVVTARRREESLQEVPLSVTAFSAKQLQELGAGSDYGVADFTVNFNTLKQVGRELDRPIVRGQAGSAVDGEPNAGYFVDGVFVSGTIGSTTLNAVERVEVLRGPQSAQFGRATFSGAINYVTRQPTNEFEGQINTRAGTNEDFAVGGWWSGPIIEDQLLFLVSAGSDHYAGDWHNQLEPGMAYYESVPPVSARVINSFIPDPPQGGDHSRLGGEETTDYLVKLLVRPFQGTELDLKYDYLQSKDTHVAALVWTELNCFVPPADYVPPANPDDPLRPGEQPWYRTSQGAYCGELKGDGLPDRVNIPDFRNGVQIKPPEGQDPADWFVPPGDPGIDRRTDRYLVGLSQDLGEYSLTARAAYNQDHRDNGLDLDHTENRAIFGLFNFVTHLDRRDSSYELRFASPDELPVRGEIGGYYYEYRERNLNRSIVGPGNFFTTLFFDPEAPPAFLPGDGFTLARINTIRNKAVFGTLEWDLTESWTLALEGRYANDSKKIEAANINPATGQPITDSISTDAFTPRITLRDQVNDALMVYVLAAKGNKPADFNNGLFQPNVLPVATLAAIASGDAVIQEETAWTYEAGIKSTWLENRLIANLAVFYIDWKDLAVFDLEAVPAAGGTTNTTTVGRNAGTAKSYGYELETNFAVTDNLRLIANVGYSNARYVDARDDSTLALTGDGDISGNRIPNSPPVSLVLGLVAKAPVATNLTVFLRPDYVYESWRYTTASNTVQIPNRQLVNLRAGVEADHWIVTGYLRNLLNDDPQTANLNFIDFGAPNLSNGLSPNLWALNPSPGRELGLEVQYSYGN